MLFLRRYSYLRLVFALKKEGYFLEEYIIFVRLDVQLKQAVNDVNTEAGISENAFSSKQYFHNNA